MHFFRLLPFALFATACGSPSERSHDERPSLPPQHESAPIAAERYALALSDGGLRTTTANGEPVRFTWNLAIDGVAATSGEAKTQSDLVQALRELTVHGDSELDFALTLSDASGKILATNVATLALADAHDALLWSSGCATVTTKRSARDGVVTEVDAKKLLRLDLPLCDFAKVLVRPTVAITPANVAPERHDAIFACVGTISHDFFGLKDLLYIDRPQCRLGYTQATADAPRTEDLTVGRDLRAPAGMEEADIKVETFAELLTFDLAQPKARRYRLGETTAERSGEAALPFGKASDCWGLEIEVEYKDDAAAAAGIVKTARLTWRRSLDGNGKLQWIAADQTAMPEPGAINAAKQSAAKFWLMCSWENETGLSLAPQPITD